MKNNSSLQYICMYRAFYIVYHLDRPMHKVPINNEVFYVKCFYMFRCICIIFRESSFLFDKVTKSVKVINDIKRHKIHC